MGIFDCLTILLTLSGIFSYLNSRYLKWPLSFGIMLIGLVMSLLLIIFQKIFDIKLTTTMGLLTQIDFAPTFFYGILGFLLFAGALQIDFRKLGSEKVLITALSTVTVFLSSHLVGGALYLLFRLFQIELNFWYCMAFGALISPTDPVIALGIIKRDKIDKTTYCSIIGESLFNDGTSIALFTMFTMLATDKISFTPLIFINYLVKEIVGGIGVGFVMGIILVYFLRKTTTTPQVSILMSLAAVAFTYDLGMVIHVSSAISVVVLGLIVGDFIRNKGLNDESHVGINPLFFFWEILDEFLNSFLFVMIGLEILTLPITMKGPFVGFLMIPIILFARYVSILLPFKVIKLWRKNLPPNIVRNLTAAGLRGGISIAMVMFLPLDKSLEMGNFLTITYIIVVFSILVQGPILGKLTKI